MSKEKENILHNIEMHYKEINAAIKFSDDYSSMVSEAKHEATKEPGLKMSTPRKMLQRLPIALAQVKAGNNSESLSNEISQIVCSLYHSKEITKKVDNNIINQCNFKNEHYIYELWR